MVVDKDFFENNFRTISEHASRCPKCDSNDPILKTSQYCPACGTRLQKEFWCYLCKHRLAPNTTVNPEGWDPDHPTAVEICGECERYVHAACRGKFGHLNPHFGGTSCSRCNAGRFQIIY